MPRISEIGVQSAMSGLLKDGLTQLSGDQHVTFRLYRKFVSPLDGLVYWIRVLPGSEGATVAMTGGLAHETIGRDRSVQAVSGGVGAADILGGEIVNPLTGYDQDTGFREPIHVSLAGPASSHADAWTTAVWPGERFLIPAQPEFGAWVSAPSARHQFTVNLKRFVSSLSGQPLTIEQGGSLHYASITNQDEDNVTDTNTVLFTSKDEIRPFNLIGPDELYIGERDDIRFSFSSRGNYYEAADLWHYMGVALQSYNEPLIIDDPAGWTPDLYVSNSIPIWLSMPGYVPPYPGLTCPFPVYPSYLIPDNARLPHATVHIERTSALAATPTLGRRMEHDQLVSDFAKVTLWGASARKAADFMDFVLQFSRDENRIGMMREPNVIHEDHHTQVEFRVLTQKKTIEFEVAYLQSVARDMARQVIQRAVVQFNPSTEHPEPHPAIVPGAALVIDWPRSWVAGRRHPPHEAQKPMPQVTERLHRAVAMPIMTQAMKPPPVKPNTTPPVEPPPEESPPVEPRSLSAAAFKPKAKGRRRVQK